MATHQLDGHLGRSVTVDLCSPCQSVWFDIHENLQLTPGATLTLFRLIGERVAKPAVKDGDIARCPRCRAQLRRTQDLQRATRFEYFRCPNSHGRLMTFFDFLKEKDFVRPLTPRQIAELRRNVQSVNCSNCGAPVNLSHGAACGHCGSPLSMLDLNQAEALVAQLKAADKTGQPIDPALPLALARARMETEQAFKRVPGHETITSEGLALGIIGGGLGDLIRLLRGDK
jgi:hypothetical protein